MSSTPRDSVFSVGVVDVTIHPVNHTTVELNIKQEGAVNEAAFEVIAARANEKFGERVKAQIGQGWKGPHQITISLKKNLQTGEEMPAISADDINVMLSELNQQYQSGPDLDKAARELRTGKTRA